MAEHTVVYPKPGVTVHLGGSVAGFTHRMNVGVPMPADHATHFSGLGHVETEEDRQAARDLAKTPAERAQAQADAAARSVRPAALSQETAAN